MPDPAASTIAERPPVLPSKSEIQAEIEQVIMDADEGIFFGKLEMVGGIGTWEAHPGADHQGAVDRIRATIQPTPGQGRNCSCTHYSDLLIRFRDGSTKRPDVAIFCEEPRERRTAVTLIPAAVVEVISPGYEKKDTEVGAPFYLSQGIRDVILYDPPTMEVVHLREDGQKRYRSPVTIALECGCTCTV